MDILLITLLFLFCALLLAVELFILPGTTIAGIAAGCCLVAANYIVFDRFGLTVGVWVLAASLIVCCLIGYWMLRSKTLEKYSLHKSIDSTAATPEQRSVKPGDEGVAVTRLALIGNAVVPSEKDIARMVKSRAEGLLDQSDLQCQFFQSAQSPFRFGQVIDFCLQQRTHLLVGLFYMKCFHVY